MQGARHSDEEGILPITAVLRYTMFVYIFTACLPSSVPERPLNLLDSVVEQDNPAQKIEVRNG